MTQLVQGFGLKKLYYKLNMTIIKYYERLFILKFGCQKRGQEHEHIDSSVVLMPVRVLVLHSLIKGLSDGELLHG